jgi:hypothetical protein
MIVFVIPVLVFFAFSAEMGYDAIRLYKALPFRPEALEALVRMVVPCHAFDTSTSPTDASAHTEWDKPPKHPQSFDVTE